MTVSYTPSIFSVQKSGGISRYFSELLKHLATDDNITVHLPVYLSANIYLDRRYVKYPVSGILPLQGTAQKIINKQYWHADFKRRNIDIIHPTYFDEDVLLYPAVPFVITVFDMIHEEMNGQIIHDDGTSRNKRKLVRKAAKILTISEASKQQILHFYPGLSPEKIVVTHLASDFRYRSIRNGRFPNKYILFVGARSGYKNFLVLLTAYYQLQRTMDFANVHLLAVGTQSFSTDENEIIQKMNLQTKVHFFHLSDKGLESAYSHAACLVFPSKQEGFGLPLVEAMNCNCPIIASDIPVFHEIAGRAALFFDPESSKQLLGKLQLCLSSEKTRSNLKSAMTIQKKLFSWEKCAVLTKEVYSSVLNEKII